MSGDATQQPQIVGRHIPELDGIRAVAIGLVILFHTRAGARPAGGLEDAVWSSLAVGWSGVDLFFVLSGFLITGILLDTAGSPRYFRSFYIRRTLRIFPIYYAVLLAGALWTVLAPRTSGPVVIDGVPPVAMWFYVQNWVQAAHGDVPFYLTHFWSLAIEEQFYLVWPLAIAWAARTGRVTPLCVATITTAVVLRALLAGTDVGASYVTPARLDSLGAGALLASLLRGAGESPRVSPRAVAHAVLWPSAAAVIFVHATTAGFYAHDPRVLRLGLLPISTGFAACIALAVVGSSRSRWRALLRSRALRAIGRISYGMYVFHWPVALYFTLHWPFRWSYLPTQLALTAGVAAVTAALAWASYTLLERRFLGLKDALAPVSIGPGPRPAER